MRVLLRMQNAVPAVEERRIVFKALFDGDFGAFSTCVPVRIIVSMMPVFVSGEKNVHETKNVVYSNTYT